MSESLSSAVAVIAGVPVAPETSSSSIVDPVADGGAPLPVNDLARSYQPRRVWAAGLSIGWNLLIAAAFVFSGAAQGLYGQLLHAGIPAAHWTGPVYFAVLFAGYAALNFPLELWIGYLEERQFGLAKDGVRAWARDWLNGTIQHGVMFLIGACLLLVGQQLAPAAWLAWIAGVLLALFLGTTYLAGDLVPLGLFNLQRGDDGTTERLTRLARNDVPVTAARDIPPALPPVVVYSHPSLREFAGGIVGLGNRRVMMISRSTLELASDTMLRFVLLHDLGHARYHHNLLSALAGWAWVTLGLVASDQVIARHAAGAIGSPVYVAYLTLTISLWMVVGEPVLAYLGRRLEYQADRFYLRHGGTARDMRAALAELAAQNLARTESAMRRRETIFHPLPSISNRLYAAREYERRRGA